MKVPYLTKCCRRYPLKFGSKVFAWYSMVSSCFGIINGFYDLADVSYSDYPEVAADLAKLKIIFCLLDAMFSTFLLMGLYMERPHYFLSWIIAKSVLLLCDVPLYILMAYFDKLADEVGIFLFCMGLDIYGILVIHGYYIEVTSVGEKIENEA
ncbi:uncharacterized protein LOC128992351 [Macrosteles quadrilineatus]|uniref:uncharacterized protein LOC128992351 n=1 Tax=Macrosteles quadrilineatus TaxID=74068 RepID=UPI0023E20116|nr:uncharacterized protein LOC128992351 [Macrosteles quadrilineatus]